MPGEIFALFGAMLFGLSHLAVRHSHDDGWSNLNVMLSTASFSVVLFGAVIAAQVASGQLSSIKPEGLFFFALAGVFTTLMGRGTLWASIERIGAPRAASYQVTSPLVTLGLAFVLLGERVRPVALLGGAVVLLGLWLLTRETNRAQDARPPRGQTRRGLLIGIAFGLASSVSFGAGQVFRKLGLEFTPEPTLGVLIGTAVALSALAAAVLSRRAGRALWLEYRERGFPWQALLVAGLTGAAGFLIFYSYEHARVSTASVLGATEPVWTFVASCIIMRRREAPTRWLGLAILVIVVGAALVVGTG